MDRGREGARGGDAGRAPAVRGGRAATRAGGKHGGGLGCRRRRAGGAAARALFGAGAGRGAAAALVRELRRRRSGAGACAGRGAAGPGGAAAGGAGATRAGEPHARGTPHRGPVRARGGAAGADGQRRAGGVPVLPHADPGERERDGAGAPRPGPARWRGASRGDRPDGRGAAGADAQLRAQPAGARSRGGTTWSSEVAAMTPYYPVCLDLRERPCVVVGGGTVAARKVEGLLECGARVTVVAPVLGPVLKHWLQEGRIAARVRPYAEGDLEGAALAIAATNEPTVNAEIAAEARARGVWLNAADDPERCDFILPSVVRRGDLQIAISTGGRSPALARRVREDLERLLPAEYADLLPLLADLR